MTNPDVSRGSRTESLPTTAAGGRIHIFKERFEIYLDARRLNLTLMQYRIISMMAKRQGQVLTTEQIAASLHAMGANVEPAAMKNLIYQIRCRLGRENRYLIETVRGIGYRLIDHRPIEIGRRSDG